MADIRTQFSLTYSNGSVSQNIAPFTSDIDQTTARFEGGVQNIGTTAENVDFGDVSTAGWCYLKNVDSTNYVDYGLNDSGTIKAIGRLEAGEWCWFRLKPAAQLMAQANTSSVDIIKLILAD